MRSNKCKALQYMGNDKKWCVENIDNIISNRIKLSPMNLNKMMKQHLKTLDEDHRKSEEPNRQKIYDEMCRIRNIIYQNTNPELIDNSVTQKDKDDFKSLYENHKNTLYNISN